MATQTWFHLLGAGATGALLTACTALSGLDGLEVANDGPGDDAGAVTAADARAVTDAGPGVDSATLGDSASHPADSAVGLDSAASADATPIDSGSTGDDTAPASTSCVPLGVDPCTGSHENCVPDPNAVSADPLDPPSVCLSIQGAGLGEGETCTGSADCAEGLDCIGTQGGTYACQWMCYDAVTAIIAPPPFDAGALGSQPGRGGCPPLETCTLQVTGYPTWLSVCTGM
jgi:hypothetical protein